MAEEQLKNFFEDSWIDSVDLYPSAISSAAAPKLEPQPEPQRRPRPSGRKKRHKKPHIFVVAPQAAAAIATNHSRALSKVFFVFFAMVVLLGALNIVKLHSDIYAKETQINRMHDEADDTIRRATALKASTPPAMQDMTELHTYAVLDLGMVNPTAENTSFVTIERRSYTEIKTKPHQQKARLTFHWLESFGSLKDWFDF